MAKKQGYSIEWNSNYIMGYINAGIKINLKKAGADLVAKSSEQAPIDTGDLRGNCTLDLKYLDALYVSVGYNLPYALRQHEELTWRHPKGGKAKYLEDPFNANRQRYINFIAEGLWDGIRRG